MAIRNVCSIILFSSFVLSTNLTATESNTPSAIKVGTNLVTMILLADLNASIERCFEHDVSVVGSLHYISDEKFLSNGEHGVRVTVGGRIYGSDDFNEFFIESKIGASNYSQSNGKNIMSPLLEASFGHSAMFNDVVYYELKGGFTRYLDISEIAPTFAVNVGMRF